MGSGAQAPISLHHCIILDIHGSTLEIERRTAVLILVKIWLRRPATIHISHIFQHRRDCGARYIADGSGGSAPLHDGCNADPPTLEAGQFIGNRFMDHTFKRAACQLNCFVIASRPRCLARQRTTLNGVIQQIVSDNLTPTATKPPE